MKPTASPRFVSLETSVACNARCIFCPLFHGDDAMPTPPLTSMSDELFEKCIKEISQWPTPPEIIALHGRGEALLDKKFPNRIELLAQYGLVGRVVLVTNGQLLSPDIAEVLCRNNIRTLRVDFDSVNKEVYEKTRPGCKFETVRDNIIYYSRLRKKFGATTRIQVQHISTRFAGEQDALELYQLLKPHMVLNDELAVITSHGWASTWLNGQDYILRKSGQIRTRTACPQLYDRLVVQANGQIPACCFDYTLAVGSIGNAMESNLLDIWNAQPLAKIRDDIASGDESRLPAYCKHCITLFGEKPKPPSFESSIPIRHFEGGFFLIFE